MVPPVFRAAHFEFAISYVDGNSVDVPRRGSFSATIRLFSARRSCIQLSLDDRRMFPSFFQPFSRSEDETLRGMSYFCEDHLVSPNRDTYASETQK